jgi:hypothetical protein
MSLVQTQAPLRLMRRLTLRIKGRNNDAREEYFDVVVECESALEESLRGDAKRVLGKALVGMTSEEVIGDGTSRDD